MSIMQEATIKVTPIALTILGLGWLFTGVLLFDRKVLKKTGHTEKNKRIKEKGQFIKRLYERNAPHVDI